MYGRIYFVSQLVPMLQSHTSCELSHKSFCYFQHTTTQTNDSSKEEIEPESNITLTWSTNKGKYID